MFSPLGSVHIQNLKYFQVKTKKIALTEFLNAMLMNTTPREDVYDGLLCIMERLPRS